LRQWLLHLSLFFLTILSTTIAGVVIVAPDLPVTAPPLATAFDYMVYVPVYYVSIVTGLLSFAVRHPPILFDGLVFSGTLLLILTAHEMGHYIACRRYGVAATLPFFIPAPPLFLAGTFGAFIKIKSPIPSRRALLDIGLAGPLAGFIFALPVAVIGVLTLQGAPTVAGQGIVFNDPPLFRLIGWLAGKNLTDAIPNPYYMSAWIGLLVTSLNLMPVGQLDGGHGTFAVFGSRSHKIIGRMAFVIMAVLAGLGFFWHHSPSGFLYALLLAVMLAVKHPQPEIDEPLNRGRKLIAVLTLLVFALCFLPFPLSIT
jgi:membrane-associated protease RseP (regulator of RpoE activity)